MNPLQSQINEINQKVDQLRDIVQQLGNNLITATEPIPAPALATVSSSSSYAESKKENRSISNALLEHKDILSEEYSDSAFYVSGDAFMTADIQIRRLTAQLTAAYNRIAALEEQLMANRFH